MFFEFGFKELSGKNRIKFGRYLHLRLNNTGVRNATNTVCNRTVI